MELSVGNRYRIGKKIGSGSFGQIHVGVDLSTSEEVAIKLEPCTTKHPQLRYEYDVYRALEGGGACAGDGLATRRPGGRLMRRHAQWAYRRYGGSASRGTTA